MYIKKNLSVLVLLGASILGQTACVTQDNAALLNQTVGVLSSTLGQGVLRNGGTTALGVSEITAGLKQALEIGTTTVVGQLGQTNGFNLDPKIRIPLPSSLQKVDDALSVIGMNGLTDNLELRLNRAAEAATPRAKQLFINSIQQMSFSDAKEILTGSNDAATQYLRRTMGGELARDMQPIVATTLSQAGAIQAYDRIVGQYQTLPFVPDVKADLNSFVVEKALDGIFTYVASEEAAIRENPAKRTTELLQKVFGSVR